MSDVVEAAVAEIVVAGIYALCLLFVRELSVIELKSFRGLYFSSIFTFDVYDYPGIRTMLLTKNKTSVRCSVLARSLSDGIKV